MWKRDQRLTGRFKVRQTKRECQAPVLVGQEASELLRAGVESGSRKSIFMRQQRF